MADQKPVSIEKNLFIAILLTGLVVFASQYFLKPPVSATNSVATKSGPAQTDSSQQAGSGNAAQNAAAQTPPTPATAAVETPGQVKSDREEELTIDTQKFKVRFSNRGAVVQSWILKDYTDGAGKPLDLVYQKGLSRVPAPFSVVFKNQGSAGDPNQALFQMQPSEDKLGVTFEYSDGRTSTKKTFHFDPYSYLVQVSSQIIDNGVLMPHSLAWRGGFGDATVAKPATSEHSIFYDDANGLTVNQVKVADKGPSSNSGSYSFAGLEDTYFAAVVIPAANSGVELTTFADSVPDASGADEKRIGAGMGGSGLNEFPLFVGPKDQDVLKAVDPKLEPMINFGKWFGFLAKPLFIALLWTSDHMTHSFGWAIVIVTIGINLVLFPLRLTSMKSSKKMQALQPQIQAINAKYKSMTMTDPRKQDQNQELMDLYKKNGVNPAGGCVPMVLQIPFFIAFYTVLTIAIEMRGAHWMWVSDLSQPETFAIRFLPLVLIISQFLSQKLTPNPGMDPAQQKMMMIMPLGLGYIFWFLPAGLVLYYLTSNVVSIVQQLALNRGTPAPPATVTVPVKKKK